MRKLHLGVLAFTLLILGVLVGYSLVQNSYVPVALVNGDIVWLKEVEENAAVSRQLYQTGLVQDIGGKYANLFKDAAGQEELMRKVFESLIEGAIVETTVSSNVHARAEEQIEQSLQKSNTRQLNASLERLYGWDLEAFTERILWPQALQDAVVKKHGDAYEGWIASARQDADVRVWFLPYEWQEGELVSK